MKFIIDYKVYNTETSEKIIEFTRTITETSSLGGFKFAIKRDATLYKTKKGNWFTLVKGNDDKMTVYKETKESVKKIFADLDEVELYNKHFKELEEA